MQILLTLAALAVSALLFVLLQHGTANTLKSIGIAFLRAGKAHEARTSKRRAVVNEQMVRELEAA
jgi:hypothetical protein